MPVMTSAPDEKKRRYKMRLCNSEFMEQYGGKLPAGSVVVVDEDTAIRWLERNIAEQAGKDEKTAAEIKREQLKAQLVPVDDDDEDEMPRRRQPAGRTRGRARVPSKADLAGAEVVNGPSDPDDDDVTASDDDEG